MIKPEKKFRLSQNKNKVKNKKIIVRVDFNVDFAQGRIFDWHRIESVKKTLAELESAGQIILISHWDNPQPGSRAAKKFSFKKILPQIEKRLRLKIGFLKNPDERPKAKINLLENLRFWPGEKLNDQKFGRRLARLADIYINEAFSASHRRHASIVQPPKFLPSYIGPNFENELKQLNQIFKPKRPLILILGGAKISTKLPLIIHFLKKADLIILGGGLANTYLKAKGAQVGQSLIEEKTLTKVKSIDSAKIILPTDFILANKKETGLDKIKPTDRILDLGRASLELILTKIKSAETIVWNGPLGYVENKSFQNGTKTLAQALVKNKNFVLVGGGDTIAFLNRLGLINRFKRVSTGGGAMLEYLAKENLIGLEAILKSGRKKFRPISRNL